MTSTRDRLSRLVIEDQRLTVLQLLAEAKGYDLSRHVLSPALEQLGHRPSTAALRTLLSWLEEQGMVTIKMIGEDLEVATLTSRGADVASGRASCPGIKRPPPDG